MPTHFPNRRYEFSAQAGPGSQDFGFDAFLFLRAAHLTTQAPEEGVKLITFQLFDHKLRQMVAHWPVFINAEREAYSPGRAPFGGPQFAPELSAALISDFLATAEKYLFETENATGINLKSYPLAYAASTANLLTNALLRHGFEVENSEINHHIPVSDEMLENRLHSSAKRRLLKCRRHGFTFQEEAIGFLPEAYAFIKQSRAERNYALSLTFPQLADLFQRFPDNFRIFTIRTSENQPAACTIAVRINGEVLYNFYPASLQEFNTFSPTILLTAGLYQVCREEGFGILDLGTSMLTTGLNFPLIAFKKHLGGEAGLKLTFRLNARP
jgi:hypothetical protein